jgi:hypothetical protein
VLNLRLAAPRGSERVLWASPRALASRSHRLLRIFGPSSEQGVLDPQGPIASAQRLLVFNAMNTTDPDNVDKTRGFAPVSKKSES